MPDLRDQRTVYRMSNPALPTELDVLRDVTGRLDRAGLAYMLTGSLALSHYAEPRMTRVIDLVVALRPGDAETVATLFRGDYYVPDDLARAIADDGFFNLVHLANVIKVDVVVRKNTPYRLHEFTRRHHITAGSDLSIWIVSKEDLMLSKLEWARDSQSEIQLGDVRNLAATGYDPAYVEEWIRRLDLRDVWRAVNRA